MFKDRLIAGGVPEAAIVTETAAASTLENVRFGMAALADHGLHPRSALLVAKGFALRRCVATFARQHPEVRVHPCRPEASLEAAFDRSPPEFAARLVAELERLERYAAQGDIQPQEIPSEVWAAAPIAATLGDHRRLGGAALIVPMAGDASFRWGPAMHPAWAALLVGHGLIRPHPSSRLARRAPRRPLSGNVERQIDTGRWLRACRVTSNWPAMHSAWRWIRRCSGRTPTWSRPSSTGSRRSYSTRGARGGRRSRTTAAAPAPSAEPPRPHIAGVMPAIPAPPVAT